MTDTMTAEAEAEAKAKATRKTEREAEAAEKEASRVRTPVVYSVTLAGTSDDGDIEKVRAAFYSFLVDLRDAGVTIGGALTGHATAARHPRTGELTPEVVVHDDASILDDD